ncbi:MAG: MoaD/ThiS family protein [Pseudomonadota bacterium]
MSEQRPTRILFFGHLKDVAGEAGRDVILPKEIRVRTALIDWLAGEDDLLRTALSAESVRLCIDQQVVESDARFESPEEIGFLPPFSGG